MKVTIEKITNKAGDKQTIRLVYWYGSKTDENGKTKHVHILAQPEHPFCSNLNTYSETS